MSQVAKCRLVAVLMVGLSLPGFAEESDPTMEQIYTAAEKGNLDQAQSMIEQVLRNHPQSAKAHYVQAELFTEENKKAQARAEFFTAEMLNPGLTLFSVESVKRLKARLRIEGTLVPVAHDSPSAETATPTIRVPLLREHESLIAPVVINDSIKLDFIVDSGASDVSIPSDVFSTLIRTSTVTKADLTELKHYVNADGESSKAQTFVIRSLKIGGIEVHNVSASVAPANAPLLLGLSFLKHFKKWSVDNTLQELVLER